jgi:endonuclease/exonuclease/phosphatase (EEP) superfamily protein YafD
MRTKEHEPVILEPSHLEEGWYVEQNTLKVISWNIYRNNRAAAIEASLQQFVRDHDPDVLLLQETPAYEASHFSDIAVFDPYYKIYEPMHILHRPRPSIKFTSSGQLTLSKYPFAETTAYQLPALGYRARRSRLRGETVHRVALYTQLTAASGKRIGLYNVHLENRASPSGRLKQVHHLLKIIDEKHDDLVVVGGDFNTFLTATLESCLKPFHQAGFVNIYQDIRLSLLPRLDYFMIRGAQVARRMRLRGRGSDHRPIMAEITF